MHYGVVSAVTHNLSTLEHLSHFYLDYIVFGAHHTFVTAAILKLSNVWVSMVYSFSFFQFMFTKFHTMYAVQSRIFSDIFFYSRQFYIYACVCLMYSYKIGTLNEYICTSVCMW